MDTKRCQAAGESDPHEESERGEQQQRDTDARLDALGEEAGKHGRQQQGIECHGSH